MLKTLTALCAFSAMAASAAQAVTVDLATTVDPGNGSLTNPVGGLLSEDAITGSFGQIARDPDGLFELVDPSNPFAPIDLFPNEGDFSVGSLDYDDSGFTGSGVEVFPITALDTSELWTAGSSTTDISDTAIDIWFFGPNSTFVFGAPSGTVTLTDGLLTSIDLTTSVVFSADFGGFGLAPFAGNLTIAGRQFDLQIDDTVPSLAGPINFVADLSGTVNAVVPEPTAALLTLFALVRGLFLRRR